jgi:DNA-binding MarR family transcriptional regulator
VTENAGGPVAATQSRYTGFLIRRAQQSHVAAWQKLVSTEISSVQYGVLSVLFAFPQSTQRDLCEKLDLDRSTVADVVARLERRGLIHRVRDDTDRRRNRLRITAEGHSVLGILEPKVAAMDSYLTRGLSSGEVPLLRRLLGQIIEG